MKKKVEDLKDGDWAYSVSNGWAKVFTTSHDKYPFKHNSSTYTKTGKLYTDDKYPSLFTYDPINGTRPPHEFRKGQVIWVWDEGKGKKFAATYRETIGNKILTEYARWDHAKPMTIEDIT